MFVIFRSYSCYGGHWIVIDVPEITPVGDYTWKLVVGNTQVNITWCMAIRVLDVPAVPVQQVDTTNLTVPALASWEQHMVTYGEKHCNNTVCCGWEAAPWYYDGVRVYRQIHEYTGNEAFMDCVEYQKVYFEYVISNNGQ